MVRVPGGPFRYRNTKPVRLDDFWLDRYEVTNRQFKEFVDQGGYREPRFWKEPFVRDGRALAWDEAMALLRDATGRPGPAAWELGSHPEGQEDYPVSGVSWYEAAAYAEFAGKSLPTFFHWFRAAELGIVSEILLLSNFGGEGPSPVGHHKGLGPFGTYDQAGNVREWVTNATGERRYSLGGAWNDPSYLYSGPEIQQPWDRLPTVGFRCARYTAPPAAETLAPVEYGTFDARLFAREAGAGRGLRRLSEPLRLRRDAARRARGGRGRRPASLAQGDRQLRGRVRRRARDGAPLPAEGPARPAPGGGLLSELVGGRLAVEPRHRGPRVLVPGAQRTRRPLPRLQGHVREAPPRGRPARSQRLSRPDDPAGQGPRALARLSPDPKRRARRSRRLPRLEPGGVRGPADRARSSPGSPPWCWWAAGCRRARTRARSIP